MADFPLAAGGFLSEAVSNSTVNANASPNVKGTYAELITSTPWDADGLLVQLQINSTTVQALMDFAIGGSGSEVIVMSNVLIAQTSRVSTWVHIPISIPAGSRVAARTQASSGGQAIAVQAHLLRGGLWSPPPGGSIITLGADTSDSGGQVLDPGGTINTNGAWTQLSASLAQDIAAVFLMVGNRQNSSATDQAGNFFLELATGAAAAEVAAWGPIRFGSSAGGTYGPLPAIWFPLSIPAGTRLSARAKSAINDATDRLYDIVVYALVI